MSPLAARAARIEPFHVMEVVKQADALERAGRSVIHLSIGEPDFAATVPVRRAAALAIEQGRTQYTPALGLHCCASALASGTRRASASASIRQQSLLRRELRGHCCSPAPHWSNGTPRC
jgi:aspartate/methionine/tyrosine aminotransferase